MKFLIDWFERILALFAPSAGIDGMPVVQTEEPEPVKEEKVAKPAPKVTKASLTKLTKAQIQEEAASHGVTVSTKLKKDEMVKEVLKQLK